MTHPDPHRCPGCSGVGVLSDDPQVLRCASCGGMFTSGEPISSMQAERVVRVFHDMLPNAYEDGQFYFDLDVYPNDHDSPVRMHGWADVKTKRVVQWG